MQIEILYAPKELNSNITNQNKPYSNIYVIERLADRWHQNDLYTIKKTVLEFYLLQMWLTDYYNHKNMTNNSITCI